MITKRSNRSRNAISPMFVAASMVSQFSFAEIVFRDDFETGDLSKVFGAAKWTSTTAGNTTVALSPNASMAARLFYRGDLDPAKDATAELRFDLGALYKNLWIQYDIYLPENYVHRSVSPSNNKFLRLWGSDYNNKEKIGFSTWRLSSGTSSLRADWGANGGALGPKGDYDDTFFQDVDRGKWHTVRVYVEAASSTAEYGTLQVWKNGLKSCDNTKLVNNYYDGEPHAYRYGYILGWANSGYDQDTVFFIDNVMFATQEADLPGLATAPAAPVLTVE